MSKKGMANGLTTYGERDFSLYLRRLFARSLGNIGALLQGCLWRAKAGATNDRFWRNADIGPTWVG